MSKNQHILFPFLKYLEVPFTNHYLTEVTAVPSSNTLLGISNILKEKYQIECVCLRVAKDDIFKLDTPFIVQLGDAKNSLALVTDVSPTQISLVYKNKTFFSSKAHLFATWTGVVLFAEPNQTSREEKYWENFAVDALKKLRIPLIIIISAALLIYFGRTNLFDLSHTKWTTLGFLFSYLLGAALSGLLLSQMVNKSDSFVERVCSSGNKNGCSKILEGNASKILGLIGWSEIGLTYFIGSLLAFLFVNEAIGILFILSVLALPYTFWSIYYQWKVANQWCPFCLSVQVILWVIFFLHLTTFYPFSIHINIHQVIHALACFLIPALVLWLVIPLAKSHQDLKEVTTRYKSLKFSEEIIASALKLSRPVDTNDASSIIFGNPKSNLAITIVTSLHCPHCKEANKQLKELLRLYKEKVCVQIVFKIQKLFAASDRNEEMMIRHLISVYKTYDLTTAEEVYHQLYDKGIKDHQQFIQLYPASEHLPVVDQEIETQAKWLDKVTISGTPTVFINRYQLPRWWYDISDLKQFLLFEMVHEINDNLRSN